VLAWHEACRDRRISLLGHSAGCAVVLAAAEILPPDSVDRIILLAPSVCDAYDVRPTLRAARDGMDVFYSSRDCLILGVGMRIFGTAERQCRTAAGAVRLHAGLRRRRRAVREASAAPVGPRPSLERAQRRPFRHEPAGLLAGVRAAAVIVN
jgi:pimeloyl-ACP methyl ester carboxylesterase